MICLSDVGLAVVAGCRSLTRVVMRRQNEHSLAAFKDALVGSDHFRVPALSGSDLLRATRIDETGAAGRKVFVFAAFTLHQADTAVAGFSRGCPSGWLSISEQAWLAEQ